MRILYTAIFLFLTVSLYGQKSTLLQNVNVRAKELKHSLNKTGDSLILEGKRTIYKVEIFNNNYEESLIVKDSKVTIPLNNVPVGRFVVEAALPDRLIVITLLRNEAISPAINVPKQRRNTSLFGDTPTTKVAIAKPNLKKNGVESKVAVVNNELNPSDKIAVGTDKKIASNDVPEVMTKKKQSLFETTGSTTDNTVATVANETEIIDIKPQVIDTELTLFDTESTVIEINRTVNNEKSKISKNIIENAGRRVVESYWIVYRTNNSHSSGREMRFGDQELVEKMISHNNLDRKTRTGKLNKLIIWEIYDVSKFLKYKMKNRNGFNSEADCFNSVPFYKTDNDSLQP